MKRKIHIATFDIETDPFLKNRVPRPFCCGFYDGIQSRTWWGANCLDQFIAWIKVQSIKYTIYAHNGGKFDFIYLLRAGHLSNPLKLINSSISQANFYGHELRDSLKILPFSLDTYKKDKIDYQKFELDHRENFKEEILEYLEADCRYLHEIVSAFIERFGMSLTIGSTALKELRKFHPFERRKKFFDENFRQYFFGGRVECLTKNNINKGNFKVYDVNSMYPHTMSSFNHPAGRYTTFTNQFENIDHLIDREGVCKHGEIYFATIEATSIGALPVRYKDGISFPHTTGEFFACSHEIKTAIKLGLLKIHKIKKLHVFWGVQKFNEFVNKFIDEKQNSPKKSTNYIFAKLILNSAYGKFAQNPENYFDCFIVGGQEDKPKDMQLFADYGTFEIWRRKAECQFFNDVSIAASITSAARSVLLDAIFKAKNPLYCDTDAIICESLEVEHDEYKLGAWKEEACGDIFYLAGKKMYALYNSKHVPKYVKLASKGVRLTGDEIKALSKGAVIECEFDAPKFKLDGRDVFIKRKVKSRL